MTRITATRRIQFCAGHRVDGHENKCRNLHGHNYVVFFEAEGSHPDAGPQSEDGLDEIGRVIDFSVLKDRLGGYIDEFWGHGFIVGEADKVVRGVLDGMPETKVFVMDKNPTAENMASYLLLDVAPFLLQDTGVRIIKVTLWETENCYAVSELGR